jgi:two-component system LytT family response regulator
MKIRSTHNKTPLKKVQNSIRIGSKHKGCNIQIEEILYLEAYQNYTFFHLTTGVRLLSGKPLKYYEELLNESGFIRTHRSFLVQLVHIKTYECKYRLLRLKGDKKLLVSYRKRYHISKIIKENSESLYREAV